MISRAGLLGLLLMAAFATWSSAFAFRQPGLRIREDTGRRFDGATEVEALGISSIPIGKRQLGGARTGNGRRRFSGGVEVLQAAPVGPSSAPEKSEGKKKKKPPEVSVKEAVQSWSEDSLDTRRFKNKKVHVCNAEALPEVLSDLWSLIAECSRIKYAAMADDHSYSAHVLFVAARCNVLKDYGMMRHMDKVLDFCSGGCEDFGHTLALQHYHPDLVLPPSQDRKPNEKLSGHLARVVEYARSPYPAFGLTVASGRATRFEPLQADDDIDQMRLELEMVYNSAAGCSTDDDVDAHGAEHGVIPSRPEEVMEKTMDWLSEFSSEREARGTPTGSGEPASVREEESDEGKKDRRGSGYSRFLSSNDAYDVLMSGLSTPEEVLSQIWSIVTQLQGKAAPILASSLEATVRSGSEGKRNNGGVLNKQQQENGQEREQEREQERGQEQEHKQEQEQGQSEPLASTLLVTPRLHPFNSAQFDNFAQNLGIALKQTPIVDRIEVEVYHPEYVCDEGVIDPDRRSPFPTLLIKHCGLKDQLFEPSGVYRHVVPPLKLPLEAEVSAPEEDA